MRLLVCGQRNLTRDALPVLRDALSEAIQANGMADGFCLAHGDARGADRLWEEALASLYAERTECWMPVHRFPARWDAEGRMAGPLRNERMLRQVQPTHWLAASTTEEPSTPGTAHMVGLLRAAEVPGRVVLVSRE